MEDCGGALEVLSEDLHDCGKVFRDLSVLRITVAKRIEQFLCDINLNNIRPIVQIVENGS